LQKRTLATIGYIVLKQFCRNDLFSSTSQAALTKHCSCH